MATWRDEKKRYRQHQARKKQLPASYLDAIDAVERFTEHILMDHPVDPWAAKERRRLADAIQHAARAEA